MSAPRARSSDRELVEWAGRVALHVSSPVASRRRPQRYCQRWNHRHRDRLPLRLHRGGGCLPCRRSRDRLNAGDLVCDGLLESELPSTHVDRSPPPAQSQDREGRSQENRAELLSDFGRCDLCGRRGGRRSGPTFMARREMTCGEIRFPLGREPC